MKREFLKGLELSDEAIDKIMAEHGKAVNEFKTQAESVEDFKNQIAGRDEQLKELKKVSTGNDELQAKLKELQELNDRTKTEYEERLQKQSFDFALDRSLSTSVKNTKAVKALLDLDILKIENDQLVGLNEQLEKLKETDGYLFRESQDQEKPTVSTGEHKNNENEKLDAFTEVMSKI